MPGRTMTVTHKGETITVCEGQNDALEFRFATHRVTPEATTFPKACHEALTWLIHNAGGMKGTYRRDTT